MLRTVTLALLGLMTMLAGCDSTQLQSGGYYLYWELPRRERPIVVRAALARLQNDVVIETVNWGSQQLALKGTMSFGNLKAEARGARGMHAERVKFKGDIETPQEASGAFDYLRNEELVMEGEWRLVHEELFRRRQAARRAEQE